MKKAISVLLLLGIGIVAGVVLTLVAYPQLTALLHLEAVMEGKAEESGEKKILYWVAPMDPNYRRDKPGKSPMGMDLIPVYEEDGGGTDAGPGAVRISPDVVNNLGVRTAEVMSAELHSAIRTVGYVGYDEDQLIHIHPRVNGWIEKLYIKASGDPVKKGEPLYDIYSPELVNAQEELLLAIERKSPRLINAAENRLAALRVPREAISRLKESGRVRQTITFSSPQDGIVDNLVIRQGYYVTPGSTIMSIGTLAQVWVEAEIFERQASLVTVGMPVSMDLDYLPGREWHGSVDYVYPTLDATTRTARVRLRFDNDDMLLKPNMFARITIHAKSSEKTLTVPREAVIRTGQVNRVVLALGEGRFKSVNVRIGRYDEKSAEILEGLAEGDEIVVSAQFLLDSESSKTSDFRRMNHDETPEPPQSVWTEADINSIAPQENRINATHRAISEWDWPEMTMDFTLAPSVDAASIKKGMRLHIEITKTEKGDYEITTIHVPGSEESRSLDDLSIEDMDLDNMTLE
ncbi:MAG: efflux RND transporter periplasmic adaptor subunit [Desulfopila sp.]|nr:efflux RND transporter periplasmic adaptor subunit [Desulfopila sp.]